MIEEVRKEVCKLLNKDNSGHGMDHVERVLEMSLKFAEVENADKEIVALIALLHDVDDYKLFGMEDAENLTNAKNILEQCFVEDNIKEQVLNAIKTIGYSKRIKNITPTTLEGMVVSDADMCDILGANGILRVYAYHLKHNSPFFDKNIFPLQNVTTDNYAICAKTGVCHIFEKVLKLKNLMLTDSGKKEAIGKHNIMVEFLYHFFEEENAPEWIDYLDSYLNDAKMNN